MNAHARRIHHLTQDESTLVLCFRLLSPAAQVAALALLREHANDAAHDPGGNVVQIQRNLTNP